MATCSYCAAPLKGAICEYCGNRNDIDLNDLSFSSAKPHENRYCPSCEVPLITVNVGKGNKKIYIERCGGCFGLFFDKGELESLLEISIDKASKEVDYRRLNQIMEHPYHRDTLEYRRCPVCKTFMQRKNYRRHSGIIIDRCVEHGIWLDSGELLQIMDYIRLGGDESEGMRDISYVNTKKKRDISSNLPQEIPQSQRLTLAEVFIATIDDIVAIFS